MVFSRFKTTLIITASILIGFSLVIIQTPDKVNALSGSEFQAARIMDDGVFFNPNTMTAGQIQEFMNAKVPVCDTYGTQQYAGMTRAEYSATRGYYPPFTCLKDYVTTTVNKSVEPGICNGHTAGTKTAAQIIYEVAQSCGVSPKVLLVLLQKEQSLVTDDWPWPTQYRSATGYGCPDTAPCDAEYYGYFNQVYMAARQFKRYAAYPSNYNYRSDRNNYIQYNPNAGCGGSTVFIVNQATAGLYNYTPYQPNASALANLYGTGDSCGAYGNRNFWRMYNDWFGATIASTFAWTPVSQSAYTDDTKITGRGLHNARPGERIYIKFEARNTGNFTWSNGGANPIRAGTMRGYDRISMFADPTWLSPARPATMKEPLVAPGEVGSFEFWIKIPPNANGGYNEYFGLVSEGNSWFPDQGLYFGINVIPNVYSWQLISQYAAADDSNAVGRSLIDLEPGERVYVSMRMKNTGNVAWLNSGFNPVHLGITRPTDRYSMFFDDSWLGQNRPANMKEASVAPGEIATFGFWMKVPDRPGPFYEYFTPVVEGLTWMTDIGLNFYGTIKNPIYTYNLQSQYAYSNSTKTTPIGLHNLVQGSTVFIGFTVANTGNITWYKNGPYPVGVGTSRPVERISPFFADAWLGQTRPTRMKETSVAPGQIATFEFEYKVPSKAGNYLEYVNLVAEGKTWMPDIGINFNSKVL